MATLAGIGGTLDAGQTIEAGHYAPGGARRWRVSGESLASASVFRLRQAGVDRRLRGWQVGAYGGGTPRW